MRVDPNKEAAARAASDSKAEKGGARSARKAAGARVPRDDSLATSQIGALLGKHLHAVSAPEIQGAAAASEAVGKATEQIGKQPAEALAAQANLTPEQVLGLLGE